MAKLTPIHPGNGNLHWGERLEIPADGDWDADSLILVPVTLLRSKGDLVMDRLRHTVWARASKTHRFSLLEFQEVRMVNAPVGAEWTAWVRAESR